MHLVLRITSAINMIGGLLACLNAVNMFFSGNNLTSNFFISILAGVISIACAYVSFVAGTAGWLGAGGDKERLNRALFFGKLNILFAMINSIQTLMNGLTLSNIQYSIFGLIVPFLFLSSAISVSKATKNS